MILVTGAAGKTGRAITRALANHGVEVRALIRKPEQVALVEGNGASECVVGDMGSPGMLIDAMEHVEAVYHIPPNVSELEIEIGELAINAACSLTVPRFIYHSVLHPHLERMTHHWRKMRVEEALIESGLAFTILQPAAYMQNVLAMRDILEEESVYQIPYGKDTSLCMVDLEDVAEAAAIVMTQSGHEHAIYELAGPEVLTQIEVVETIGAVTGQDIRLRSMSLEAWRNEAKAAGLSHYQIEALSAMFSHYDQHGFWGNPNILTWILGRKPTRFKSFCEREFQRR